MQELDCHGSVWCSAAAAEVQDRARGLIVISAGEEEKRRGSRQREENKARLSMQQLIKEDHPVSIR